MTTRTWRAKRRIGAAALVALIGSTLAFATPAGADGHDDDRVAGDNRYETAAAIYTELNGVGVDCGGVTIVNGENWPDGLVAGSYADPVLLVTADSIPAATAGALASCTPSYIRVVGGTSVVSSDVLEALGAYDYDGDLPERFAGADRYETALAVADDIDDEPCDVYLATGTNFPDALAAGPLVAEMDSGVMLLNSGSSLRADVKAFMANMDDGSCDNLENVPMVTILGGTSAIPASVETEINAMGIDTLRLDGDNRNDTAVKILEHSYALYDDGEIDYDYTDCIILVNGNGFADALGAAAWSYQMDCGILLTNADSIPTETATYHLDNCDDIDDVYVAGGFAVVSDAIHLAAIAAATCVPVEVTATLSTVSSANAVVSVGDDCVGGTFDYVRLTAVPGSGTDGVFGNRWDVEITEGAVSEVTLLDYDDGVSDVFANPELRVTIDVDGEDGTTAAEFVEIWNNMPEAKDLYTASLGANGATGVWTTTGPAPYSDCFDEYQADEAPDDGGDPPTDVYGNSEAYADQIITLAFNQDVTDELGLALELSDFGNATSGSFDELSGDGADYTITLARATSTGDLAEVGEEVVVNATSKDHPSESISDFVALS